MEADESSTGSASVMLTDPDYNLILIDNTSFKASLVVTLRPTVISRARYPSC